MKLYSLAVCLLFSALSQAQTFDDRPLTRGSFQRAASVALPSVVQITVRATASFDPLTGQQGGGGTGSGIIFTRDGLIVTNRHVVELAIIDIKVRLYDDREYAAEFVAKAADTDVAVIRIVNPPDDLVPAVLRDTRNMFPGELVLAIGAPRGLRNTITQGVVSAIRAASDLQNPFPHRVIQTDADINPGNSGGPLVDLDGAVVGMNSYIATDNGGGSIGLGFSIPGSVVRTVMQQLASTVSPSLSAQSAPGTLSDTDAPLVTGNGWIGVLVQDLDADLRAIFSIPIGTTCILVTGTEQGSPSERAGLKQGDCIASFTAYNDSGDLSVAADFLWEVRNQAVGSVLSLTVVSRNGATRTVSVTVIAKP